MGLTVHWHFCLFLNFIKSCPQKNSTASSSNASKRISPPKKKSKISNRNTKTSNSQQQLSTAQSSSVAVVIPSTVHSKPQQVVVPQPIIQPPIHDDKEGHLIYYNGQVIDSRCELILIKNEGILFDIEIFQYLSLTFLLSHRFLRQIPTCRMSLYTRYSTLPLFNFLFQLKLLRHLVKEHLEKLYKSKTYAVLIQSNLHQKL